jgi:four helix bundle protein
VATVKDFRELRVYQNAFEAAMRIFHLTKKWPREERYSLVDQIRRSSRSVCANIAEAWRKRNYQGLFASTLNHGDAEAGETIVWLGFALQCGYLPNADYLALKEAYDHICAQLVTMTKRAAQWCGQR